MNTFKLIVWSTAFVLAYPFAWVGRKMLGLHIWIAKNATEALNRCG